VVPSSQLNWLAQLTWTGGDSFLAVGQNLNPSGALRTLGLFRGVITAGATNFTQLAGTQGVRRFGITGKGEYAIYSDTGLTIWRIAPGGGAPEVLATLPFESGRVIADLSCRADLCVVLTLEGPPQFPGFPFARATIWKVLLETGAVSSLRQFDAPTPTALALSPVNGDLAILKNGQLWLSKGFLP